MNDEMEKREVMRETIARMQGSGPRENLITAIAAIRSGPDGIGEASARALVDAFDEYLAEGPDRAAALVARINMGPEDLLDERDAAILRAEKAEQELRELRAKVNGTNGTSAHEPESEPTAEEALS